MATNSNVNTSPPGRSWRDGANAMLALADGLHELACVYAKSRGSVPTGHLTVGRGGPLSPVVVHTVIGGSDVERRAEVDRIAAALGVRGAADYFSCPDERLLNAVYLAERPFGPVTYRVVTHLDPPVPPTFGDVSAAEDLPVVDWSAAEAALLEGRAALEGLASAGSAPAGLAPVAAVTAHQP